MQSLYKAKILNSGCMDPSRVHTTSSGNSQLNQDSIKFLHATRGKFSCYSTLLKYCSIPVIYTLVRVTTAQLRNMFKIGAMLSRRLFRSYQILKEFCERLRDSNIKKYLILFGRNS